MFVDVKDDMFDGNNGESVIRTIQRVIHERFNNLIDVNDQKIQINKTINDEFRQSESAKVLLKMIHKRITTNLKRLQIQTRF